MIFVSEINLAWAAGFLEGEGCFHFSRTPSVTAAQKEIEPLEAMLGMFGGTIYHRPGRGKTKPYYVWQLNGDPAIDLMRRVWLHMSSRRRSQIDYVLDKAASRSGYRRGSGHGNAKLNDDLVREIRATEGSKTQEQWAAELGMSQTAIGYVRRGKTWRHVSMPPLAEAA